MAENDLQVNNEAESVASAVDASVEAEALIENALIKQSRRAASQTVYSRPEEWVNRISHLLAVLLSIAAAALMIVKAALVPMNARGIVAICLYSFSLIFQFSMSTIYHFQPMGKRRSVFRRLDRCSVAVLMAGTYAPFALIHMYTHSPAWAIVLASVVLGLGIFPITLNAVSLVRFRTLSLVAYVLMGFTAVLRIDLLACNVTAFVLLLVGAAVYAIGLLFYNAKNIRFNHAIWHFFVLAGATIHFVAVYFYLIP